MSVPTPQHAFQPRSSGERVSRAIKADISNVGSTPTAKALLLGSVVMAVASCVANLSVVADSELATDNTIELAMHSSTVATLVFSLVAGVVASTADFRFGRIDQLLLSEPGRGILLGAKAFVGALVGLLYGVIGAIVAVLATAGYFATNGESLDVQSAAVVHPLLGLFVGTSLFGAIGVAIGTAVQNQPAGIAGALSWLLIVEPIALLGLPDVGRWFPGAAGLALTRSPDPNLMDQMPGGLMLLAWTVVAVSLALVRFNRSNF